MTDEQVLLASLEAQGVEFMKSFSLGKWKRSREDQEVPQSIHNVKPRVNKDHAGDSEGEEEWTGFTSDDVNDFDATERSNPDSEGARILPAGFVC